jgi:redox-sensitive bicupin YhaK (pirin superfamily)
MEIFSYILEGAIAHRDSMGNGRELLPGEIQLMSAGTGVTHSEFNPRDDAPLHLLQIWIEPAQQGLAPSYTEWRPSDADRGGEDVVVISPDGRDGSAVIHQDAVVRRLLLAPGGQVQHEVHDGRGAWVQLIRGAMTANGERLAPGDGACTEGAGTLALRADERVEALLFDLA